MREGEQELIRNLENLCPDQNISHLISCFFPSLSVPGLEEKCKRSLLMGSSWLFQLLFLESLETGMVFSRVYS